MNYSFTTEELYMKRDQIPRFRMQKMNVNSDRSSFEGVPFIQLRAILSRYYLLLDQEDDLVQNISIDHNTLFLVNNKQEMIMRHYLEHEITHAEFIEKIEQFTYGMNKVIRSLVKNEKKLVDLRTQMETYKHQYIHLVNTDSTIKKYGAVKELMNPFTYNIKKINSDMIHWEDGIETTQYSSETESDGEPSTIFEDYEEGINMNE